MCALATYSNARILYFSPNGNSRLHISCCTCPANSPVKLVNKHLRTCVTAPVMCGGHHKYTNISSTRGRKQRIPAMVVLWERFQESLEYFDFHGAHQTEPTSESHLWICIGFHAPTGWRRLSKLTTPGCMSSFRFLNNLIWVPVLLLCFIFHGKFR